jgi:hypothetical protein
MAHQMVSISKQDQRPVVKFIGVKACQSVEIHTRMRIIHGLACVVQKTVDWLCTFQMGGNKWWTLRNWNGFTLLLIQRKMHVNNAVHVVQCWTIQFLLTATDHHHLHCACNPTGS